MATAVSDECGVQETLSQVNLATGKRQVRVLLIEDSQEAKWLVEHSLQKYGDGKYQLKWATTLSDGLEQLATHEIDIVLLDLGLPETSGSASYTRLHEVAPDVPVVVLSGDTSEETQVSVIVGGVNEYLVKEQASGPLLVEAIRSALHAK